MSEKNEMKASLLAFKKTNVAVLDHCALTKIPYTPRPGAYVVLSFARRETDYADVIIAPFMTFFFDSGKGSGAEWEPEYGPIQKWVETTEQAKTETFAGNPVSSRRHWFYSWVQDNCLAWSQLAVDREGLKDALLRGDFDYIFGVLERWAQPENVSADSVQGMIGGGDDN